MGKAFYKLVSHFHTLSSSVPNGVTNIVFVRDPWLLGPSGFHGNQKAPWKVGEREEGQDKVWRRGPRGVTQDDLVSLLLWLSKWMTGQWRLRASRRKLERTESHVLGAEHDLKAGTEGQEGAPSDHLTACEMNATFPGPPSKASRL